MTTAGRQGFSHYKAQTAIAGGLVIRLSRFSLFLVVFLQLDRFPVELTVPGFLSQGIVVLPCATGLVVPGCDTPGHISFAIASAALIPAFLLRQDCGDAVDDVARFFDSLCKTSYFFAVMI